MPPFPTDRRGVLLLARELMIQLYERVTPNALGPEEYESSAAREFDRLLAIVADCVAGEESAGAILGFEPETEEEILSETFNTLRRLAIERSSAPEASARN